MSRVLPVCEVTDPFCTADGPESRGFTDRCFRCRRYACMSCMIHWTVPFYGRQWICHDCAVVMPEGGEGVRTHLSRLAGRLVTLEVRRRVPIAAPAINEKRSDPAPKRTRRQRGPLDTPQRPARARPYPKALMEVLGYGTSEQRSGT